jgi:glutathionylspermidine synthase
MILEIVKSLSNKTHEELIQMYTEMKDTLVYNSELIYNYDINNKLVNRIRYKDGR